MSENESTEKDVNNRITQGRSTTEFHYMVEKHQNEKKVKVEKDIIDKTEYKQLVWYDYINRIDNAR